MYCFNNCLLGLGDKSELDSVSKDKSMVAWGDGGNIFPYSLIYIYVDIFMDIYIYRYICIFISI